MKRDIHTIILYMLIAVIVFPCSVQSAITPPNARLSSADLDELSENFSEPDMFYAPFMFWFWDEPVGDVSYPEKTRTMAKAMLEKGINPGYVDARASFTEIHKITPKVPSLSKDEWLSPAWFNAYDAALQETLKEGAYIGYVDGYDWPIGRAAGRVVEHNPDLVKEALQWSIDEIEGGTSIDISPSFFTVAARIHTQSEPKATIYSDSLVLLDEGKWVAPGEGTWRIYKFSLITRGKDPYYRHGYLNTGLAKAFIKEAHEPYEARYRNQMGKAITGAFCDTEGNYGVGDGIPWSTDLERLYKQKTNRDIRRWMPLMIDDDVEGRCARARYDWFDSVSDIYAGFFEEVNDWLAKRDMYYISNVWEESLQWQASMVSDHFKVQRAFSMPGTDCLVTKGYHVHDFKETASVSEFEGRRLQSEIMGAGGWDHFTPINMKQITNCVIAWGVNHIVPHGTYMTRVFEGNPWIPDWYDGNAMWKDMDVWADFTRRASYINSQGRVDPDVLLLNPMDSAWVLLGSDNKKIWLNPTATDIRILNNIYTEEVRHINKVYSDAIAQLTGARVEYLIADKYYVNQMSIVGNELHRKEFKFKTVIIPPVAVLPLKVAEKLLDFASKGGHVYALGSLPRGSTDNGFNDPEMEKVVAALRKQKTFYDISSTGLQKSIDAGAPGLASPIEFISGKYRMIQLHRVIDGQDAFWLVNNSPERRQCQVRIKDASGSVSIWDCETGERYGIGAVADGNDLIVDLTFWEHEAYWLMVDGSAAQESVAKMSFPKLDILTTVTGQWNTSIDSTIQPKLEYPVEVPDVYSPTAGVMHDLTEWATWKDLPEKFSGLVDYKKTIELPDFSGDLVIDLGNVKHIAEVWVNGKHAGAKLWGPYIFQSKNFHPGKNEIHVRVGNLVQNNYGTKSPSGMLGPVVIKTTTGERRVRKPLRD